MRYLSKLFFLTAMSMTVAIVGCDKDDDDAPETSIVNNNISVTVPNVPPEVKNVKLLVDCTINLDWVVDEETGEGGFKTNITGEEIEIGFYSGSKLTIDLPETLDNQFLDMTIKNIEVPDGISVSNCDSKGIGGFLVGYDNDGNQVGWFFYGKFDEEKERFLMAMLSYIDSDVIITGETTIGELIKAKAIYDCNLKKGWNFLYILFSGDEENGLVTRTTTSNPGGLVWIFEKF